MEQTGGLNGTAAAACGGKVRNISNFCVTCCGNFFCTGTILAPKGPDQALIPEKNLSKIEQKRPVNQKKQGIFVTWKVQQGCTDLFALSSGKYWIFLDIWPRGRSGDHFRSKELTFKLSLEIMKRWRKSIEGGWAAIYQKPPGLTSRDFRRPLKLPFIG